MQRAWPVHPSLATKLLGPRASRLAWTHSMPVPSKARGPCLPGAARLLRMPTSMLRWITWSRLPSKPSRAIPQEVRDGHGPHGLGKSPTLSSTNRCPLSLALPSALCAARRPGSCQPAPFPKATKLVSDLPVQAAVPDCNAAGLRTNPQRLGRSALRTVSTCQVPRSITSATSVTSRLCTSPRPASLCR